MRSLAVVVLAPGPEFTAGVDQFVGPAGLQTFRSQPVEALHVPILHRPSWLNVDRLDLPLLHQLKKYLVVRSGPLSQRIDSGFSQVRSSLRATRCPLMLLSTSKETHSCVNVSTTCVPQKPDPSAKPTI